MLNIEKRPKFVDLIGPLERMRSDQILQNNDPFPWPGSGNSVSSFENSLSSSQSSNAPTSDFGNGATDEVVSRGRTKSKSAFSFDF